ncbi:interleukin-17 receptor A isoform X2 [Triplophysa dalaica]|uniref:interleukin-17 receptor A isoform X2 n=1 Tax=Triplophysa dalaica TaxID=1582913 RepID=UPI0024DF9F74|nr:interleukin-17 receptor A isoform X2 [Triplophysa dalaica]
MAVKSLFLLKFLSFTMTTSSLHLIDHPPMNCSQEELECMVQVGNCSNEGWVMSQVDAARSAHSVTSKVTALRDQGGKYAPVLQLTWSQPPDGSIYSINGTKVCVVEIATNKSECVCYIFLNKLPWTRNLKNEMWTFSLNRLVVYMGFKYQIFVTNLPKSALGSVTKEINITVPENLWNPELVWVVEKNKESNLVITINFKPKVFSDQFKVSMLSPDLHLELSYIILKIQPLYVQCLNNCLDYKEKIDVCPYLPKPPADFTVLVILVSLMVTLAVVCSCTAFLQYKHFHKAAPSSDTSTCAKPKLEFKPVQEHRRVFIIYSLDHPLYKDIILKLCAFLRAKCGTDVTLDLLDSSWLGTIGRIQWLDMQREQICKSSDKVLVLCSPGVYAKWRAMCGEQSVRLKEDACSPIGDMLTPALSLIIPDFAYASSFHKYIVAYFDQVCSENDVPAPFNTVVKYKLMKHFEELYFRILGVEKHEPGWIKCIEGIRENDYFTCPSGRALGDAIDMFHKYQLKNPNWFEMELLGPDDEGEAASFEPICAMDISYNAVTTCYEVTETHGAQTGVNMIKCCNEDEHILMTSTEETGIKLNKPSFVVTTDVQFSSPVLSSFTSIDAKEIPETTTKCGKTCLMLTTSVNPCEHL